ncbi:MAG TPA: EamA family transporter [Candidatus Limnocylindrales bacterium]|nr:EamA family transporter [Candidatus Limnocylindrales bacterium]
MTAPAQPTPSSDTTPATSAHPGTAPIDYVLFALLGFFWGSSYLFIKIGVEDGLTPFTLIMLRLLIGFGLLSVVVAAAREKLPPFGRIYGHLFVMGAINIAIPFSLITWAEQSVDSSVAAILNAAVPLFVMIIAAIFLRDERLTPNRALGLVVGFVGVAILVGFNPADLASGDMAGEIALIGSTISYAFGAVYAKHNIRGLRPMIPAIFQVFFGLVITTTLAFVFENPLATTFTIESLFAVVWLGLFGSGLAYLVFFRLLGRWGATRTSMVAYLLPLYGIVLGAIVLNEPVDGRLVLGTALIIGGVALVNSTLGSRLLLRRRPTVEATTPR